MKRRRHLTDRDAATPALLPIFLAATLAVVAAVVLIGRTDSDWADVVAVALLLGTLALVLGAILRLLGDGEPASEGDSPGTDSTDRATARQGASRASRAGRP